MLIVLALFSWFAVSVPAAVVIGHFLGAGRSGAVRSPAPPASTTPMGRVLVHR